LVEENSLRLVQIDALPIHHDIHEAPFHTGSHTIEHLAFLFIFSKDKKRQCWVLPAVSRTLLQHCSELDRPNRHKRRNVLLHWLTVVEACYSIHSFATVLSHVLGPCTHLKAELSCRLEQLRSEI